MSFDFTIVVWGPWHIETLDRAMLPTLLSPGNLPEILRNFSASLNIITREQDLAKIDALASVAQLRAVLPIKVFAGTTRYHVDAGEHHAWWLGAAMRAASDGAFAVFLSPDHVWPDSAVMNFCKPLAAGKRAVLAPPHFRVVSETFLPALHAMARADGTIRLSPRETVSLGAQHLHPLCATALEGVRYGRRGIERLWPVDQEGFVLIQTTREVIAFDPRRCELSGCTILRNVESLSETYLSKSCEDFMMLSLAPLTYGFDAFASGDSADERTLAHWSTVAENDVPLNGEIVQQMVRLSNCQIDERRWEAVECAVGKWVGNFLLWRQVYLIAREIRNRGRHLASGVIALTAQEVKIDDGFEATPKTLFIPDDDAMSALPATELSSLFDRNSNQELLRFIMAHVAEGYVPVSSCTAGDFNIQETIFVDQHCIHFIDKCLRW